MRSLLLLSALVTLSILAIPAGAHAQDWRECAGFGGRAPSGGLSFGPRLVAQAADDEGVDAQLGGQLHALIGVLPALQLDLGLGFAQWGEEQDAIHDVPILIGFRLHPNPYDRVRVFVSASGGLTAWWTGRGDDAAWLTADAGLGVQAHVVGPLFFEIAVHGQVRHRVDHDVTRWAIDSTAGFAVLM
ncbi:MAG TPA: hypothetical protein RMH99_07545 [Sandaracinaceae bacterium LLY-WYZ-13_1]|nr:hypothetical protein [Sandaracinaceae bacterium LLY-WYZ-13_1]